MTEVAPEAEFQFIAHLPEWGLDFPIKDKDWGGALPTVRPTEGSTVWGAVFAVPKEQIADVNELESVEQRTALEVEAMDRNGKRHQVVVHRYEGNGKTKTPVSKEYLKLMLQGSRHWSLPAGWIAGLEEHLQNGH